MENNQLVIDFERICRLCMSEAPVMSSIFADNLGEVPLPLRIMACVSIELSQSDGLPSQICNACLYQVDGWYKFKDLSESADTALRKLLLKEHVPYETITKIQNAAEDIKGHFQPVTNDSVMFSSAVDPTEPNVLIDLPTREESSSQPRTFEVIHQTNLDQLLGSEESESDTKPLEALREQLKENGIELPEVTENGDDSSSTDENLSLWAHKEKLMKEKMLKRRVKVRRKVKNSVLKGESCVTEKFCRTIQAQTSMDDDFELSEFFNVENFLNISADPTLEEKSTKNKRTQTSRELLSLKRRFRIRPAVPSACTLCDKVYKNSEILRQHMKSHHFSGSIECSQCQTTFTSLRSLKYHEQRKHSNLEALPCSFCGKKFLDKKYLRVHENIHSQTNQYVCQFCGRKFIMKTNLTVHISRHHTQKTNDFICQVCGKAFPFKLYLKKHFKTHTDSKPHQCPHCEARFRETTLLRKHINCIHLKLRPFLCQYCHKTFTRSLYLREHMETQHLGIPKKMECHRCGQTFHNRSRLRQHDCECRMDVLQ